MTKKYNDKNNAQKDSKNSLFEDKNSKEETERLTSGTSVKVTRYSDGSSKVHFGGPVGDVNFDENGEQC